MAYLDSKEVTINVISKSGTTTEPAIAFRFLRQYMEKRYGEEAATRIIVTTDEEHGALRSLALKRVYTISHSKGYWWTILRFHSSRIITNCCSRL